MINQRAAAFIPARGGSKGIPRKNLIPFLGQPLIVHSIAAAQRAKGIIEVIVSTDDDEIAAVSREAGALVLTRPPELAHDQATTESAIAHFLAATEGPGAICAPPELVVLLQPTSPWRPPDGIDEALEEVIRQGCDSLLSLAPCHGFFWRLQGTEIRACYDFLQRPRRQDLLPEEINYVETGSIYVFTRAHFEATGNRLGGRIGRVIHAEEYGLEIDSFADLDALEAIARRASIGTAPDGP